jgi:hypothetical protein
MTLISLHLMRLLGKIGRSETGTTETSRDDPSIPLPVGKRKCSGQRPRAGFDPLRTLAGARRSLNASPVLFGRGSDPVHVDRKSPTPVSVFVEMRRPASSTGWIRHERNRYCRARPWSVTASRNSVIFLFMNSTSAGLAGEAAKWPCRDGITMYCAPGMCFAS